MTLSGLGYWIASLGRLISLSLAATGLALSCLVHVATFFGLGLPMVCLFAMHLGIFVVFGRAILVSERPQFNWERPWESWRRGQLWEIPRGCPVWMRVMVPCVTAYGLLSFLIFGPSAPRHPPPGPDLTIVVRMFSGVRMFFYAASLAMLYARRCPQRHVVGLHDHCCKRCGLPIVEERTPSAT